MRTIGNILWLVLAGIWLAAGYVVAGALLCITIIGIPFGIQTMKIGVATLTPFGKEIVELPDANSTLRIIFNVIWILLFGWEIAVAHAASALILAITIIGIPFAVQHLKLIPLALLPFGRDLR